MMKEKWENYKADTPEFWRKVGDSLLAVSATSGVPAVMMDYKYTGIAIFIMGIVGKFLSNFFKK